MPLIAVLKNAPGSVDPTQSFLLPSSGTLLNINDTVVLPILGSQWASAQFFVSLAGTATATAEISVDGGTNWIAAPLAKKVSAVSANPTVQAISATTLVTGDVWEVPLPGNCTHFRLRGAAGTATTVSLSSLQPWAGGAPVAAVLYDTTSGTNSALDTGTLDASGWASVSYFFTMNGGVPSFTIQEVDDAGASTASIITSTAALMGGFGSSTLGGTAGLAAATAFLNPPRRLRFQSAAIAAQTSRIRVQGRR
jgi:hypothetical protein